MITKGHRNGFASPGFVGNPNIIERGWQVALNKSLHKLEFEEFD
jgi:hypothetical protein